MKLINYIVLSAFIVIGFTSCSKYLDKLDNPNLVTDPPLNGLLAQTTYNTGYNVYRMGYSVSYFVQYQASSAKGSDTEVYNEVDYSTTWTAFYSTMMNIQQMLDKAEATGAYHHVGVGKIMLAYNLNMLITAFGDVPFSEALKGGELLTPKFDDQAQLHTTTINLLNEGITELQKANPSLLLDPAGDVIHQGEVDAWIKTAQALKARFMNQLTRKASYDPNAVLTQLGNAYSSNSDDAAMTVFRGRSPWNQVAYNNTVLLLDGWLNEQFVDALDGTTFGVEDPRLPLIATLTKFGDYRGTPSGAGRIGTGTDDEESYLSVDGFYSKGNAPLWLVTYSEMKFIEAEAAFRAGNKTRAYAAYLAGIEAHMDRMGVAAAAKNAYLSNPVVAVGEDDITLELIAKEKYVAMFLNPEAWVDARRFDYNYKDFTLPIGASLNTFIRRLAYPTVEFSRNGANVPNYGGLDQRLAFDQP
ncbi:MAG TPA: SusD/RagB family nutrient-binding outer membrane lipoprotein [Flavihumibacter sp.]|jgi:hypothetical protein